MHRLVRLALLAGALPLVAQAQTPRVEAALDHARGVASARGIGAAEFAVTDAYRDARRGTDYVYLRQMLAGLEVVGTEASLLIGQGGDVRHALGLNRLVSGLRDVRTTPVLSAPEAANAVARHNGLGAGAFAVVSGDDRAVTLTDGGIALEPVPARLVLHLGESGLHLAWEVLLYERSAQHAWQSYVDALTGEVLAQADLVVHDAFAVAPEAHTAPMRARTLVPEGISPFVSATASAFASSYRVYGLPVEAPIYAAVTPPADGRTLVTDPADPTASPEGWHSTGSTSYTITRGNNVHAYTDTNADNVPDAGSSPDGGAGLAFDFPLDLNQQPSTYRPAAVANLFYWNNVIHDVLYQYGFDEASGNFQVNNFGRGGQGNDDVRAEAQDGSGVNNANFFTPSDGSRPRMQMFLGVNPEPDVDGSFDNGVVIHEYGHGISNRLTGGPSTSGCLSNGEQMGEGWSDWYAMIMTMNAADARSQSRGMGNYLFAYGPDGDGIRLAPYTTDFSVNGYTYGDTQGMFAVHQIGFVWATILWEVTWDVVDAHGFDPDIYNAGGTAGNQIMMQLVTEGLRLQPCSPGFVTGRDAILAADDNLYGGAHRATLEAAFARRGLGYSASQGSSGINSDNQEAFDLWPDGPPANQPPTASFTSSCNGLTCDFTDTSTDADGTIASRSWAFGDGGSSTAANPTHTYGASGTYTVTLTVTDDDGDSASTSQSVSVSDGPPPAAISLTVTRSNGRKAKNNLRWSPADGGRVNVYRDGVVISRTRDDGSFSDRGGSASSVYQVCETDSSDCSNEASASGALALASAAVTSASVVAIDTEVRVAPNPVTSTARIQFGLEAAADVQLAVYDAVGRQVALLASGRYDVGVHSADFDAGALPSGVYIYRFTSGADVQTGQIVVTR